MVSSDADVARVVDVAKGLEGLRRQDGIHAAAVVITKDPLTEYLPIQRKPEAGKPIEDAPVVTQYEMHGVEDLGLLKMDFLGLRNLDVISDCLELIRQTTGDRSSTSTRRARRRAHLRAAARGDTIGVFQLESAPMRALIRSLAPTEFDDVAALVALYRPGPMAANMHNDYADRKNGRKPVEYIHPDAEELLGDTYGLMIYQESVMRMAQKFAGYSLAEADLAPQGDGQEDPRGDGEGAGEVHHRCRRPGLRPFARGRDVRHHRPVRRLRLQQVALVRLRLRGVPDRLSSRRTIPSSTCRPCSPR